LVAVPKRFAIFRSGFGYVVQSSPPWRAREINSGHAGMQLTRR
jgi:hypothetical protein